MCRPLTDPRPPGGHPAGAKAIPRRSEAIRHLLRCAAQGASAQLGRAHRDQRGTISILTVFCLLMFTMLLVMIVNAATHLDDKIRMQNAADASAYSGGVVLARGMNAIACTNHLLADVFAMTAFLREGRDRTAESLTPEILDEWEQVAEKFAGAEFDKFAELGQALQEKIPQEEELVAAYGDLNQYAAEYGLGVYEAILAEQMIPEFQRAVVRTIPQLAQQTSADIAWRNGMKSRELAALAGGGSGSSGSDDRSPQTGVLWRMSVEPVAYSGEEDPMTRTMPAVDPDPYQSDYGMLPDASAYFDAALVQRRELAKFYLEEWTRDKMVMFDRHAELSQFSNLWRIFTCAHLDDLLNDEYSDTNLPMIIRAVQPGLPPEQLNIGDPQQLNEYLEQNLLFLSVVYREQLQETGPGLFRNPIDEQSDALTFAQVSVFLPRARRYLSTGGSQEQVPIGGAPGFSGGFDLGPPPDNGGVGDIAPEDERWPSEGWPSHWDLLNQNWTSKLVPATADAIPAILQSDPSQGQFRPPDLGGADMRTINRVNTH